MPYSHLTGRSTSDHTPWKGFPGRRRTRLRSSTRIVLGHFLFKIELARTLGLAVELERYEQTIGNALVRGLDREFGQPVRRCGPERDALEEDAHAVQRAAPDGAVPGTEVVPCAPRLFAPGAASSVA